MFSSVAGVVSLLSPVTDGGQNNKHLTQGTVSSILLGAPEQGEEDTAPKNVLGQATQR